MTAFPPAHPARLQAFAAAYSLRDGALEEAFRYLAFGDKGRNLLPLALQFPEAKFVGVEDNSEAREQARAMAMSCNIDNVEFVTAAAIEGAFDFVVAHGCYSWLDHQEQRLLLERIAGALAPRGVALVSYNTLPGWALRGVVRAAMMRAIPDGVADSRERMHAARGRLAKLKRHVPPGDNPYFALLSSEIELAQHKTERELDDDLLATHNEALHFGDFIARAQEHGLAFLCESLSATPDGALQDAVGRELMAEGLGRIAAEECLDVLCYRQFRATLLCRADSAVLPEPDYRALREHGLFAASLRVQAEEPFLGPGRALAFATAAGVVIETDRPLLKAALLVLAEQWPRGLSASALIREAVAALELRGFSEDNSAAEIQATIDNLVELAHRHQLQLLPWTPAFRREVDAAPRLRTLSRHELSRGGALTSARHEPVVLDAFGTTLAQLLDGQRDFPTLVRAMLDRIDSGALTLDVQLPTSERHKLIAQWVMRGVVNLRDLGVLEST